jgi:peptide/nickel transport system substrate-binding protein
VKPAGNPGRRACRWALLVLAVTLAVPLRGAMAAPAPGGALALGITADPITLDPHASAYANTYLVGSLNLIESLVYQQPDGKVVPWLASALRVSPDGRTFTFTLRSDVRFTDGAPFNADAVKWNLDRIVNPTFKPGGAITALVGYAGTTVVDERTAQVHFKEPYAPFLAYAAGGVLGMLSPKTTPAQSSAAVAHGAVGSGPFVVAEYVTNDHVTFVRNPGYNRRAPWSDHQGPPYLERLVWKIAPEPETRAITLSSGETQMIYVLGYGPGGGAILAQLRKDPRLIEDARPFPGSAYLWLFNVRVPPMDDVRVRQALIYGINRRAIITALYRGLGAPSCGLVSAVLLPDPAACAAYPYNPTKAAQLLDEAGWKMGPNHVRMKDGRPLALVFNSLNNGGGDLPDVQPVQAQLLELGVSLKIKSQAIGGFADDNFRCADHASTIFLRTNDPDTLYALFATANIGANFNWSCYSNPDADRMLAEGRSTLDPAKRQALYVRLDHTLLDQAVAMPMMDELSVWVRRSNVLGVRYNYSTYPALSDAYLAR